MSSIIVSADGVCIGIAQSANITTTTSSYQLNCYRVRFDSLKMSNAFSTQIANQNTQTRPLQITLDHNDKITRINNAWISSVDYNYTTPGWIIADKLEMAVESMHTIDKKEVKCKYCVEYSIPHHDWMVAELTSNFSKEKVLSMLGVIPRNGNISNTYRSQAIEIIRCHFPEYYNNMEKLFVLI